MALTSIQRQLYRGEEYYFEESCAHRGNLLQGWDNIWIENANNNINNNNNHGGGSGNINGSSNNGNGNAGTSASGLSDSKIMIDIPSSSSAASAGAGNHHQGNKSSSTTSSSLSSASLRKMPSDYRWFSSSCGIPLPIFAITGASARGGGGGGGGGGGSKYYDNPNYVDGGRVAALERPSLMMNDDNMDEAHKTQHTSPHPVPKDEKMGEEDKEDKVGGVNTKENDGIISGSGGVVVVDAAADYDEVRAVSATSSSPSSQVVASSKS